MARKSRKILAGAEFETPKAVTYATCGYARISIDGERSEDSIESQSAIIQDYVGDKADLNLRGMITDLGFTGRDFDRPGYIELMDGIKDGKIQCVVVKDLSRLGRSYIEVGELLFDTFPAYNIRFISVNDHYDSFADDAARKKLLILFKNLVNHMYSRDLGQKIRSAHAVKQQRGELAGLPPYGYIRGADCKTLMPDNDAAEIVKMVFDMRLNGMSANKIAKHLTREGIPSPQSRRYQLGQISHEKFAGRIVWNVGTVSKMLQCETYTGTLVQGKYDCDGKRHKMLPKDQWVRHENTHPAIISLEQFEAVQTLMKDAAAKYERGKGKALPENRYAGKVFCSRCGKAAVRVTGGSTQILFYYRCRYCDDDLKAELGLNRTKKLPLVALDAIVMNYVQAGIATLVNDGRFIAEITKSASFQQNQSELSRERAKWEKILNGTDKTLSTAYAHHLDGLLDSREFALVREKVESDKKDAAAKLAFAESELRKYGDKAKEHNYWRKVYDTFVTAETPTKELIQALVHRIELTPVTNEVHVMLNYKDGLEEYRNAVADMGNGVSVNA